MARSAGLSGAPIYRRKIPFFFSTRGTTKNQGAPLPQLPQNLRIVTTPMVEILLVEKRNKKLAPYIGPAPAPRRRAGDATPNLLDR